MESITLSLRQRKLLNQIQNQTSHITGQALAKQLNVSPRTIRSDIVEINHALTTCNAKISAERSKGYFLECTDMDSFQEQFKTDDLLATREDRIRYLTFQLCLSEVPLNQYDLEDEMYVSKTTLDNDIATLKRRYVLSEPYIKLKHLDDAWEFEHSESKRRTILNQLFHNDWNYNTTGNTYYNYHFLDADILNLIMEITARHLYNHYFQIEDANLVSLNLSLAIMYYRMLSGHVLPDVPFTTDINDTVFHLCTDIFDAIEEAFSCVFPPQEKYAIYQHLCDSHVEDANQFTFQTVSHYFNPLFIEMADCYIQKIQTTFQIDFSGDEDFYITLLQYLRYLKSQGHIFNTQGNANLLRRNLLIDSEIAYLIQPIALGYLGYYLDEKELIYLTFCISGALEGYWVHHPEQRIRTVICCHLNLTAIWAIKRKTLGAFGNYIDIKALLPINARTAYNFQNTDLVLTTVQKKITNQANTQVLRISPEMMPDDYIRIQQLVSDRCQRFFFRNETKSLASLLSDAYWHENITVTERFSIIECMSEDFIRDGLVSPRFLEDLLRRESTFTYGFQPGALFLYSLEPAKKTQLSVATLKHRILWNSSKIRVIIMACFDASEQPLLLKLLQEIYVDHDNIDYFRKVHSKTELLHFFSAPKNCD